MKKKFFLVLTFIFFICVVSFWKIVDKGYDRQNKIILFIKKIIPSKIAREVESKIFMIPNLKKKNYLLDIQVKKYEQGLEGNLFREQSIVSSNKKNYYIKEFFLPFKRLDIKLGWAATENSKRAHYLEIVNDKVLVISGLGQTIYFSKENINNKSLNQKEIKNNILSYLNQNNYELVGIRDLFVEDNYVYISLQHKDTKGFTINVYRAALNFEELQFKPFFITNEYWQEYNVFSGGRIESFKDNKILFSIGYSYVKLAAQDKNSFLGKIISIDKSTKKHELISMGHRNPQGLFYVENFNLIINTEHGPRGGDEINLNFIKKNEIPNYGWDISSYGVEYDGTKYRDSHSAHGFVEPFKYYTPSIGISELVYLPSNKNLDGKKYLFVSSLRAASIYKIEIDDEFRQITNEDRIFFKEQRLRDLEFDEKLGVFFILFETTPSIGILYSKN
jgi:glucose/arabinose dehydrogenase